MALISKADKEEGMTSSSPRRPQYVLDQLYLSNNNTSNLVISLFSPYLPKLFSLTLFHIEAYIVVVFILGGIFNV